MKMILQTHYYLTLFSFLSLNMMDFGCGGKVHFVSGQIEAPPASAPTPAPTPYSDHFNFQTPAGIPILLFYIEPQKSMRDIRQAMKQAFQSFLDHFFTSIVYWNFLYVGINQSLDKKTQALWYLPFESKLTKAQWKEGALSFLTKSLDSITFGLPDPASQGFQSPLQSLTNALSLLVSQHTLNHAFFGGEKNLSWVHFFYFRNLDIPSEPSTLDATYNQREQTSFLRNLKFSPYSSFRYQIFSFSHLDSNSTCQPLPSHVSQIFQTLLSPLVKHHEEICPFFQAPGLPNFGGLQISGLDSLMKRMVSLTLEPHQRVILRKRPLIESLEITYESASGTSAYDKMKMTLLPRHEYTYEPLTNEIHFSMAALQKLRLGDTLSVTYQPEGRSEGRD